MGDIAGKGLRGGEEGCASYGEPKGGVEGGQGKRTRGGNELLMLTRSMQATPSVFAHVML